MLDLGGNAKVSSPTRVPLIHEDITTEQFKHTIIFHHFIYTRLAVTTFVFFLSNVNKCNLNVPYLAIEESMS